MNRLKRKADPLKLLACSSVLPLVSACVEFNNNGFNSASLMEDSALTFEEADESFQASSVSFSSHASGASSSDASPAISGATDEPALEGITVTLHSTSDCSGTALDSTTVTDGDYSFSELTLPTEGTYSFYVRFGSGLCHSTDLSYNYDATAPTSPGLTLNGGASGTHFPELVLTSSVTESNSTGLEMCIAENGTCSGCDYVPYSSTTSIELSDTSAGSKTISVKFRDAAGNESTCASDSITLAGLTVEPQYADAPDWNDYIRALDPETECFGNGNADEVGQVESVCLHGGDRRKVVTQFNSCSGLTMSDSAGAFDWTCAVSAGAAVFTSRLKTGKGLQDLLEGTTTPGWKNLSVTLQEGSKTVTTSPAQWWTNPVVNPPDNSGAPGTPQTLSGAATIYFIPASRTTAGYALNGNKSALVVARGQTLKWTDGKGNSFAGSRSMVLFSQFGGTHFYWIEGAYDCGDSSDSNDRAQSGIHFGGWGSAKFSQIRNVSVRDCVSYGVNGNTFSGYHRYDSVDASHNGTGIYYLYGTYLSGRGVTTSSNTGSGFFPWGSDYLSFEGFTANSNGSDGISTGNWSDTTDMATFKEVTVQGNGGNGIVVVGAATGTVTLSDIDASRNGTGATGSGVLAASHGGNIRIENIRSHANARSGLQVLSTPWGNGPAWLSQIAVSNNGWEGILASTRITGSNLLSTGNGTAGVEIIATNESAGSILTNVTAINNTGDFTNSASGIYLGGNDQLVHNALTGNNQSHGVLANGARSTVSQIATAGNGAGGMGGGIGTMNFYQDLLVRGNLLVGNHPSGHHCTPGGWPNNLGFSNTSCTAANASIGMFDVGTTTLSLSGVFNAGGKISTSDSANSSDNSSGAGTFGDIADWFNFENPFRSWGFAGTGGSTFPDTSQRGACSATNTSCNIYDFSLDSGNTSVLGRSGDGINSNQAFTAGSACPAAAHGDEVVVTAPYCRTTPSAFTDNSTLVPAMTDEPTCTGAGNVWVAVPSRTFLKTAVELLNDDEGDDDALCESNEACLYTPNFGAYQGHGELGTCTFTDGVITDVTLYGYSSNGR